MRIYTEICTRIIHVKFFILQMGICITVSYRMFRLCTCTVIIKRINAIYHLDAVDYLLILMHELPRKEIAKSGTIGLASEPAAC